MARYLNDGTNDAPKLRCDLNLGTLNELPAHSIWGHPEGLNKWQRLQGDGFVGVQFGRNDTLPEEGFDMPFCGLGRIDAPEDADKLARELKARGDQSATVHVGTGLEDDDQIKRLVEALLNAVDQHAFPIFLETHRATITQDIWRTVKITEWFPEIRFTGDFSHYYCGHEMVYGDFAAKLDFMAPIFARIGYLHGRIASSGCMQVPIDDIDRKPTAAIGPDYREHFAMFWTRAMAGFKQHAGPGDVLVFAPEILWPEINYARVFPDKDGNLREESDRYEQALLYKALAQRCFADA